MIRRICVDSCLAFKWVFHEEMEEEAQALRRSWTDAELIVPSSFLLECASAAYHQIRYREVTLRAALEGLRALEELPMREIAHSGLVSRAVELAKDLELTVWDTVYLAVAEAHDCEFWTVDQDLYRHARRKFPFVNLLVPGYPRVKRV